MRVEDLVLVSVDDHVVEPPDLFHDRLAAKHVERAPKLIRKDSGIDVWSFMGDELPNIGLNAVAGRPPEEYAMDPTSFDDMRSGCYDIHDRVRDMDANGVLGSMCTGPMNPVPTTAAPKVAIVEFLIELSDFGCYRMTIQSRSYGLARLVSVAEFRRCERFKS